MRTLRSFSVVSAIAATILSASPAAAQRHARHQRLAATEQSTPATSAVRAPTAPSAPCDNGDCADDFDDYTLSVVTALFPYDGATTGTQFMTLVIENRGTARAPSSVVAVAPRNHATLAKRVSFASLAPGARTTIQVPVEMGPDGVPCVTISIIPGVAPSVDQATRYALADEELAQSEWGD